MYAQFQYDNTQLLLKPLVFTNPLDTALTPEQVQLRTASVARVEAAVHATPDEVQLLNELTKALPRNVADVEFPLYMLMAHLRSPERTEREGRIHKIVAPAFVGVVGSTTLDAGAKALKLLGRLLPNSLIDAHLRAGLMAVHMAASAQKDAAWLTYSKSFKAWLSDACKRMDLPIGSPAYLLMMQALLTQPVGLQAGVNNWLTQAASHNLGPLIIESTRVSGLESDRADTFIQILIDGLANPEAVKAPAGIGAVVTENINTLRAELVEREKQMLLETIAAMQQGVPFGPSAIEIKQTA